MARYHDLYNSDVTAPEGDYVGKFGYTNGEGDDYTYQEKNAANLSYCHKWQLIPTGGLPDGSSFETMILKDANSDKVAYVEIENNGGQLRWRGCFYDDDEAGDWHFGAWEPFDWNTFTRIQYMYDRVDVAAGEWKTAGESEIDEGSLSSPRTPIQYHTGITNGPTGDGVTVVSYEDKVVWRIDRWEEIPIVAGRISETVYFNDGSPSVIAAVRPSVSETVYFDDGTPAVIATVRPSATETVYFSEMRADPVRSAAVVITDTLYLSEALHGFSTLHPSRVETAYFSTVLAPRAVGRSSIGETVYFSDGNPLVGLLVQGSLSDSVYFNDLRPDPARVARASIAQTLYLSEALQPRTVVHLEIEDYLYLNENALATYTIPAAISDTVYVTAQDPVPAVRASSEMEDALAVSDSIPYPRKDATSSIEEILYLTTLQDRSGALVGMVRDRVVFWLSWTYAWNKWLETVEDTVCFSDESSRIASTIVSVTDTVYVSDSLSPHNIVKQALNEETVYISTTVQPSLVASVEVRDTVYFNDTVYLPLLTALMSETVYFSDTPQASKAAIAQILETAYFQDPIEVVITGLLALVEDGVQFQDIARAWKNIETVSVIDHVEFSEEREILSLVFRASIIDNIVVSDTAWGLADYSVYVEDGVEFYDWSQETFRVPVGKVTMTVTISQSNVTATVKQVGVTAEIKQAGASVEVK